ncbi:ABC transporter permease [Pelobium manganitolerans]|uniref:ABC transporter permease n=1 Tax=Pelobium manganitolerans TaxID=1842495 RepID=A0A419S4L2_9SPHI|nr:ABC transporter permease [Pelobium manganitolerans]RKD15046.1 ABC transporter permease [Pelobium manganitolerans]
MNKVLLIIQREYLSRVKKKSFLLLTFLVPSLFIGMYVAIFFIYKHNDDNAKRFHVIDESGIFQNQFKDQKNLSFDYPQHSYGEAKKTARKHKDVFILHISPDFEKTGNVEIIGEKKPGIALLSDVENQMEDILRNKKLLAAGIDTAVLNNTKSKVNINAKQLTDEGEKDASVGATYAVGFLGAFLIYLALFIYGAQVMRGVIEEKTSRIVEVIVSSVKPFQLMLGKILGIGAVGLTQFLLWILLSTGLSAIGTNMLSSGDKDAVKTELKDTKNDLKAETSVQKGDAAKQFFKAAETINFTFIISTFIFYFIGGYLLYSALFAAVGSAVDSETETQQFMLPITLPLIFTFILGMNVVVNNPDSSLSFWLSVIPFTSPIAMMIRIPFGVPDWQLALSAILLIAGFVFTTWVASRIYRVGILMHGKKITYKELAKWFSYKE